MEAAQQEEYKRREAGKSSSVIPAAIKRSTGYSSSDIEKKDFIAGAVSATDSESESEFMTKIRGNREKAQLKWTPELEEKLEEILLKNQFEFRAASREFCKFVNDSSPIFYAVDVKQLQLRWTDIEIRKYRLNEADLEKSDDEAAPENELPPLEKVELEKEEEKEQASTAPVSSSLYSYADGTSSEEETPQATQSSNRVMHYNDLEELD